MRRWALLLARVLVTGGALAWVASRVDVGEAAAVLRGAPRWVYVLPGALLILNSAVHATRVRLLLDAARHPAPMPQLVGAMLRASFVGVVLPMGGAEVAKVGFVSRVCGSTPAALAAILVARLLELVPWTLLLLWGLAWGLWQHDPLVAGAASFFALAFAGVLVTSAILARSGSDLVAAAPPPLRALARRAPRRVQDFADRLGDAVVCVGGDPPRLIGSLLLTIPFSLINCLVVFVILRAHGVSAGYADVLAIIPAVDTLIALPLSINGLGVREALFVDLLAPFGATKAVAVAVALTRWIGELVRVAAGGLLVLSGGLGHPSARGSDPV